MHLNLLRTNSHLQHHARPRCDVKVCPGVPYSKQAWVKGESLICRLKGAGYGYSVRGVNKQGLIIR